MSQRIEVIILIIIIIVKMIFEQTL